MVTEPPDRPYRERGQNLHGSALHQVYQEGQFSESCLENRQWVIGNWSEEIPVSITHFLVFSITHQLLLITSLR